MMIEGEKSANFESLFANFESLFAILTKI